MIQLYSIGKAIFWSAECKESLTAHLLEPTVLVRKFPASSPALLSAGRNDMRAPPIRVGMINAMMQMPRALNLPDKTVPRKTVTKAIAEPGRASNSD